MYTIYAGTVQRGMMEHDDEADNSDDIELNSEDKKFYNERGFMHISVFRLNALQMTIMLGTS